MTDAATDIKKPARPKRLDSAANLDPSSNRFKLLAVSVISFWLITFVMLPGLMILGVSFLSRDPGQFAALPFSLHGYEALFDPLYLKITWNSFKLAAETTIWCLLLAWPFAWGVHKAAPAWRPVLLFLLILPFWTNSLIRTYALKAILGNRGLLNNTLLSLDLIDRPLRLINTEIAVIIGLVYVLLPFMILPLYASIEKLDHRLLEAAQDLGANKLSRFWHIVLPLTAPGMVAGVLLVFLPAMGMFYVADLLGGARHTLVGNLIKNQFLVLRDWPMGAAASVMLTVMMGLLILLYRFMANRVQDKGELDG